MLCPPSRASREKVYKKPIWMIGFCGKVDYDVTWWKLGGVVKFSIAGPGQEGIETEALVEMCRYAQVAGVYHVREWKFSWRDSK